MYPLLSADISAEQTLHKIAKVDTTVPQLAERVAWQLNPLFSLCDFNCFKAVLSFLGSSAVASVKQCYSKVKLQALVCSLFSSTRWIWIPFGHSAEEVTEWQSRAAVLQTRCPSFVSRPMGGFSFPQDCPAPPPWIASIPACLICLKRVNTSTTCHSEITTGKDRFPRINTKVRRCGQVLPSSCVTGAHCMTSSSLHWQNV